MDKKVLLLLAFLGIPQAQAQVSDNGTIVIQNKGLHQTTKSYIAYLKSINALKAHVNEHGAQLVITTENIDSELFKKLIQSNHVSYDDSHQMFILKQNFAGTIAKEVRLDNYLGKGSLSIIEQLKSQMTVEDDEANVEFSVMSFVAPLSPK